MARWLLKEEPTHYAFDDLVRDRTTEWSGIHNALALRHLRSMTKGEEGLYYHTGSVKAVVGRFVVDGSPHEDSADPRGSWSVRVRAGPPLARPVTLAEMRADPAFSAFDLLRNSRLSVVPVPDRTWNRIISLARTAAHAGQRPRANHAPARRRSSGST